MKKIRIKLKLSIKGVHEKLYAFISQLQIKSDLLLWLIIYWICKITRCAETGRVPPANGVIVSAVALPAGFLTVKTELTVDVVTRAMPIICSVPVARPTTV